MTRFGAVVRADSVRHLTPDGWDALVEYGVRTIVDLRRHDELSADPPLDPPVEIVHVPLSTSEEEPRIRAAWEREGGAETIRDAYEVMLELTGRNYARAVETVADADDGCVLVHCFAGKDRTGLVCGLLLRLAGVGLDDIAADYGLSADNLEPIFEPWVAETSDEAEQAIRRRMGASPPEAMSGVLERLEERFGDVESYLLDAGAAPAALDRARARLLG